MQNFFEKCITFNVFIYFRNNETEMDGQIFRKRHNTN